MQEEFDVEKWCNDNPMNYTKAIELLKVDSRGEVFWTIWKIAKLHISKKVYKYYSLTDNKKLNDIKLQTLRDEKIFLSPMSALNDPFEGKALFYNEKNLQYIERLKEHEGRLIDDFSSMGLITSMTKNNVNSMPMWAHYSNNHSGYCVEYDTEEKRNSLLRSLLMPVQYTNERLDVTDIVKGQAEKIINLIERNIQLGIKESLFDDFLLIWITILYSCVKHISWQYENELRVLVGQTEKQHINAHPNSIFIGAKCDLYHKERLIEIANYLKISAYQMYFDEHSPFFELKYKQVN
ncbi:hypothetical protein CN392_17945 [Bacillus cereus]|uniref:DUF2971 domain-containing protein n=1 Tax=Bacillus cereus TaxID=1396 RepID=UPI000BF598F8|nr:DUF2971 domain-containing protein [Bacillus cereus]PFB33651.1 hypothetical protein CN392_17945 [Bacillus cereus]